MSIEQQTRQPPVPPPALLPPDDSPWQSAPKSDAAAGNYQLFVHRRGPWLQFRSAAGFAILEATLPIVDLAPALENFRILHLSDLHARSSWDPAYDELIEHVRSDLPDLILFTGDFVDNRFDHRPGFPVVKKLLSQLESRLGIVTILGNHDGDLIGPPLAKLNVTVLVNQVLRLGSDSGMIELIGMAGVDRRDLDKTFLRSIGPTRTGAVRIAMSHFPDAIRAAAEFLKPDVYLTGHTHGGQICLPGQFPILRHDSLPRRFCGGIHRAFDMWMVTNRGFGFSSLPIRAFCPAEIVYLRLVRGTPAAAGPHVEELVACRQT